MEWFSSRKLAEADAAGRRGRQVFNASNEIKYAFVEKTQLRSRSNCST